MEAVEAVGSSSTLREKTVIPEEKRNENHHQPRKKNNNHHKLKHFLSVPSRIKAQIKCLEPVQPAVRM